MHLSIGQEAVSVGVCTALRRDDVVFPTYRGHAAYLAKGGDLNAMVAELYGKDTGCARGKGGSMHLIEASAGVMGATAVVGTTIPQAVGYAVAMKIQKSDRVVTTFFGDGASEEGVSHESLNFAALKNLPVLFICENNAYSIHTPQRNRQPQCDITKWAASYGIPAERIEGNDTRKIHERVSEAVEKMRAGAGPHFFECETYRWKEHVGPNEDFHFGYRSREEFEPWLQNDEVRVIGELLAPEVRARIESDVEARVAAAFEFAENSPFPAAEELWTSVYKERAA